MGSYYLRSTANGPVDLVESWLPSLSAPGTDSVSSFTDSENEKITSPPTPPLNPLGFNDYIGITSYLEDLPLSSVFSSGASPPYGVAAPSFFNLGTQSDSFNDIPTSDLLDGDLRYEVLAEAAEFLFNRPPQESPLDTAFRSEFFRSGHVLKNTIPVHIRPSGISTSASARPTAQSPLACRKRKCDHLPVESPEKKIKAPLNDPISPENLTIESAKHILHSTWMQGDPFEAETIVLAHAEEALFQAIHVRSLGRESSPKFDKTCSSATQAAIAKVAVKAKDMRKRVFLKAREIVKKTLDVESSTSDAVKDKVADLRDNFEFIYGKGNEAEDERNPFEADMIKQLIWYVLYGYESSLANGKDTRDNYTGSIPEALFVTVSTFLYIALTEYEYGTWTPSHLAKQWSSTNEKLRTTMKSAFTGHKEKKLDFDVLVREAWAQQGRDYYKCPQAQSEETTSSPYKRRRP